MPPHLRHRRSRFLWSTFMVFYGAILWWNFMVEYHKSPRTAYNTLEVEQGMESHFKPPLALKERAVLAAPAAVKAGLSKATAILKSYQ